VKRRPEEEQQDRAPLHCREDYQTKAALAREKPGAAFGVYGTYDCNSRACLEDMEIDTKTV
jgi:hypothetical protein